MRFYSLHLDKNRKTNAYCKFLFFQVFDIQRNRILFYPRQVILLLAKHPDWCCGFTVMATSGFDSLRNSFSIMFISSFLNVRMQPKQQKTGFNLAKGTSCYCWKRLLPPFFLSKIQWVKKENVLLQHLFFCPNSVSFSSFFSGEEVKMKKGAFLTAGLYQKKAEKINRRLRSKHRQCGGDKVYFFVTICAEKK